MNCVFGYITTYNICAITQTWLHWYLNFKVLTAIVFLFHFQQEQEREEERKRLARERREKEREREERKRQRDRENKGTEDITSPDHLLGRDRYNS